ncbi:DNA-binding protein inhibitor ID-2-like [Argopecten irradians]|uniref:DNA-binding protein inhibitor ID-2-like n=1 Tax=Argopecten irradians TaxID=31199 RepID=UPI003715B0AD
MKAVTQACMRPAVELGIRQESRIFKPKMDETSAEMTECFTKLKDLVPSVPQNKKVSKTQLLQHVIDYILDLELALEVPTVLGSLSPTSCRSPLSEKSQPNTVLAEICPLGDVSK